jgi:hypothetical protein
VIKTEGIIIKRELDDDNKPGGQRKKPKKMIGKVTIDLTEDDESSEPAIELD